MSERHPQFYRDFDFFFKHVAEARKKRRASPTLARSWLLLGVVGAIAAPAATSVLAVAGFTSRSALKRWRQTTGEAELESLQARVMRARRIFEELSAELETDPDGAESEIELLFEDLVDDQTLVD